MQPLVSSCGKSILPLRMPPRRWAAHRFAVLNSPLTWVELSGLEPLTSCMPWGMLTFNTGKR